MKKAEEYLKSLYFKNGIKEQDYKFWYDANKQLLDQMVTAIKQVQIDAINETVKRCAERAKINRKGYFESTTEEVLLGLDVYISDEDDRPSFIDVIDKQSILQVAKELKKEFEDG